MPKHLRRTRLSTNWLCLYVTRTTIFSRAFNLIASSLTFNELRAKRRRNRWPACNKPYLLLQDLLQVRAGDVCICATTVYLLARFTGIQVDE